MDKKVIVEKIGSQPPIPVIQPQQNYTLVRPSDGQNPLFLAYSVLKPPIQRHEANNVVLNVNPSNTLIVRDAPTVSNYYQITNNVQTCIVVTPQKPRDVTNYRTDSRTPPVNTPKSTSTKNLANAFNNWKKKSLKDCKATTDATPSPASNSKKPPNVSKRETDSNVKPIKTPKSITISMKNLVALDEDTKKSLSATSSVANFLEKDTLEKGLEVLDSLDNASLTLLITKIMGALNKMCGDYLEEQLTAHLGAEKYRRIAAQGLTTFSEFLASRHAMVRRESPVIADRTDVVAAAPFGKSKRFVKLDPKKLLMEEMSNSDTKSKALPSRDEQTKSDSGSKIVDSFAEADKCISEKINFFRERDMSGVKSRVDQPLLNVPVRSDQEKSTETSINILQDRSRVNNYEQNESLNIIIGNDNENVNKTMRKKPRKQPREDPFKFDPLLSRPSESVPENKSVILSSPDMLNSANSSISTSGSFSGSKRKLELSSNPTSPDENNDLTNFNIKPSDIVEGDSLSSRMSKAFKMNDSIVIQKSSFEGNPLENGFPGFCASNDRFNPKLRYLLARLDDQGRGLTHLKQRRIDENVVDIEVEAESKLVVEKASAPKACAPEAIHIGEVEMEIDERALELDAKIKNNTGNCELGKDDECGESGAKKEQFDYRHVENLETSPSVKCIKTNDNDTGPSDVKITTVKTESSHATTTPDTIREMKSDHGPCSKDGSPSSSDDISKACDSPDLQRTVKDLTQLLKTFNDDAVPFVRTLSFESGISNDSFESFAQKAKDNVLIREENCGEVDCVVEAGNKVQDEESKASSSAQIVCDESTNVKSEDLGEDPENVGSNETSSCEPVEADKMCCEESEAPTDDDCVIVDEANVSTSIAFAPNNVNKRNNKLHRQQLKNYLHRKVSSLSRIIQRRIQKVTRIFKYLNTMIGEATKNRRRNTTVDVLRQKSRSLYGIAKEVDKTYLRFRNGNFMKLKSTLGRLVVQEGRGVLSSRAVLGKRNRSDNKSQKEQAEVITKAPKVDKEVQVTFQLGSLKTYGRSKKSFSKSKSDSAVSSASTEGTFVQSFSPNKSDPLLDIRKSMLSRGAPDDASDPGCQIVQCCFYANDKVTGGDLNLNFDPRVKPELSQPDLVVFQMGQERDVVNKTRQVDQSKKNRGRPKNNDKKSGDNNSKKDLKLMKERESFDPEGAKGGRKRKRSTSRKSGKRLRPKSYALRGRVREMQPDYNSNSDERNDVPPAPIERVYPLRSRQGGNSALDVEGAGGLTTHI